MASVSVEKRGKKWRYRFTASTVGGKREVIQKGGFDTKKDAQAAGAEAMALYTATGIVQASAEISVADFLDRWMEAYVRANLKPETISNYEKKLRIHIKPAIGAYQMKAVTAVVLQDFINGLYNRGYSRNTLLTIKGILSGAFRYAVFNERLIMQSPAEPIKVPSYRAIPDTPTRKRPHVFVPKEKMQQIFERFPEGTAAHIPMQLGYRCGLRVGEAFAVTWGDIDFDAKKLSVNRQTQWDQERQVWYITPPKYSSYRTIDLDDALVELLRKEKGRQERFRVAYGDAYVRYSTDDRGGLVTAENGELQFVSVRDNGERIQQRIMQHASSVIHHQMKFPEFDFHSLRHPYVKHGSKNFRCLM